MKENVRKVLLALGILFILGFVAFFVYKKVRVKELIENAKKAEAHGDIYAARDYYNKASKLDEDNLDIKYGLEDLEKGLVRKDANTLADIHNALSYSIVDPSVTKSADFKRPKLGDYSLYEFVSGCGKTYMESVNSYLGDQTLSTIKTKLVSNAIDGRPTAGKDIRVALYEYKSNSITMCVYIPDTFNPETGGVLYGGVRYNPNFNFEKEKNKGLTHVVFMDLSPFPQTGDVLEATDGDYASGTGRSETPLNESKYFTFMSTNLTKPIVNAWPVLMEGCILKDEKGTYYVVRGRVNSWGSFDPDYSINELMEISEEEALQNLDWVNSKLVYDRVYP